MRNVIFVATVSLVLLLTACGQSADKDAAKNAEPTATTAPEAKMAPESAPADQGAKPAEGAVAQ